MKEERPQDPQRDLGRPGRDQAVQLAFEWIGVTGSCIYQVGIQEPTPIGGEGESHETTKDEPEGQPESIPTRDPRSE